MLQEKQLPLLARDKNQDLERKVRMGKLVSANVSLRASQCLKTSDEIHHDVNTFLNMVQ